MIIKFASSKEAIEHLKQYGFDPSKAKDEEYIKKFQRKVRFDLHPDRKPEHEREAFGKKMRDFNEAFEKLKNPAQATGSKPSPTSTKDWDTVDYLNARNRSKARVGVLGRGAGIGATIGAIRSAGNNSADGRTRNTVNRVTSGAQLGSFGGTIGSLAAISKNKTDRSLHQKLQYGGAALGAAAGYGYDRFKRHQENKLQKSASDNGASHYLTQDTKLKPRTFRVVGKSGEVFDAPTKDKEFASRLSLYNKTLDPQYLKKYETGKIDLDAKHKPESSKDKKDRRKAVIRGAGLGALSGAIAMGTHQYNNHKMGDPASSLPKKERILHIAAPVLAGTAIGAWTGNRKWKHSKEMQKMATEKNRKRLRFLFDHPELVGGTVLGTAGAFMGGLKSGLDARQSNALAKNDKNIKKKNVLKEVGKGALKGGVSGGLAGGVAGHVTFNKDNLDPVTMASIYGK
ncbi:MAG: hypothetical protein ACR2MS_02630 [Weeksellaceae bacterium]